MVNLFIVLVFLLLDFLFLLLDFVFELGLRFLLLFDESVALLLESVFVFDFILLSFDFCFERVILVGELFDGLLLLFGILFELLHFFFLSFDFVLLVLQTLFLLLEEFFAFGKKVDLLLELFFFIGLDVEFVQAFLVLPLELFDLFLQLFDELDVFSFVVFLKRTELLILLLEVFDEILVFLDFVSQVLDGLFILTSLLSLGLAQRLELSKFLLQGFELGISLLLTLFLAGVFGSLFFEFFLKSFSLLLSSFDFFIESLQLLLMKLALLKRIGFHLLYFFLELLFGEKVVLVELFNLIVELA